MTLRPIPLAADNFTPLERTPWGGEVIGRKYKAALVPSAAGKRIGESWEFSAGPEFPQAALAAWLKETGTRCELLVKLLDAREPLSLQVHPFDDDPSLKPDECGKPESWLVLDAAPGAGLYLGFAKAISRAQLKDALVRGVDAKGLLHFVPVAPGDYFDLGPGVPHAIGAGVTLLEPQRVLPGKKGVTYRMYDWGRGRPLNVDECLRIVDPGRQVGEAFVETLRKRPLRKGGLSSYPANAHYQTHVLDLPGGTTSLLVRSPYAALVVLTGALELNGLSLDTGRTALLPEAAAPWTLRAPGPVTCAVVVPAGAHLELRDP